MKMHAEQGALAPKETLTEQIPLHALSPDLEFALDALGEHDPISAPKSTKLGSFVDGKVDPEKRPLLYRHFAITKVARSLADHTLTEHLTWSVQQQNPDFYDLTILPRPDAAQHNAHNNYLFGRLETALANLGGVQDVRGRIDKLTVKHALLTDADGENKEIAQLSEIAAIYRLAINANRAWAYRLAAAYGLGNFTPESARQTSLEGLAHATTRYNVFSDAEFSTYATYPIAQKLLRTQGDESHSYVLSEEDSVDLNRIAAFTHDFIKMKYREPTVQEIARHMRKKIDKIAELQNIGKLALSLDYEYEGVIFMDVVQGQLANRMASTQQDVLRFPDGKSLMDLIGSRTFDNMMQIILGLQYDFPPDQMSPRLRTIVRGRAMTYREIYQQYNLRATEAMGKVTHLGRYSWGAVGSKVLGVSSQELKAIEREAHAKLQTELMRRYGDALPFVRKESA